MNSIIITGSILDFWSHFTNKNSCIRFQHLITGCLFCRSNSKKFIWSHVQVVGCSSEQDTRHQTKTAIFYWSSRYCRFRNLHCAIFMNIPDILEYKWQYCMVINYRCIFNFTTLILASLIPISSSTLSNNFWSTLLTKSSSNFSTIICLCWNKRSTNEKGFNGSS